MSDLGGRATGSGPRESDVQQTGDLLALVDRVVDRAGGGPAEVEVFGVDETHVTVRAHGGEVESLSSASTRGIGVRVIDDHRVGYAFTVDLSESGLDAALADARRNATAATADDANVLPDAAEAAEVPRLLDPRQLDVDVDRKVNAALELEASVTGRGDPRIQGVDAALYSDSVATAAIASTRGLRGAYRRSDATLMVEVIAAQDGQRQSAYGIDFARAIDDVSPTRAADEAVERATRLLSATKPPSRRLPVVLDPHVTAQLLGVIAEPLTAEAVQRGRSLFAGKVGEQVAASAVTLVDDGRRPDGPASAPWDGEGVPTRRTVLIERGELGRFLHNTASAHRDGVASTGNASRGGFRSPPGLAPTNLHLVPGEASPEELLSELGEAFYCQQVMGLHSGANPVTGDVSVGAAGVMVRDGAFAEPIREATIAGTIPGLLTGVVGIGSDLRFLPFGGGLGGLTLVVEGMTLAGS